MWFEFEIWWKKQLTNESQIIKKNLFALFLFCSQNNLLSFQFSFSFFVFFFGWVDDDYVHDHHFWFEFFSFFFQLQNTVEKYTPTINNKCQPKTKTKMKMKKKMSRCYIYRMYSARKYDSISIKHNIYDFTPNNLAHWSRK